MDFQAPACLLFGLLAVIPWWRSRVLTPTEWRHDRMHAALRSLAILLVALAMARPVRVESTEERSLAILWDRSASVSAAADEAAAARILAAFEEASALDPAPKLTLVEIQSGPETQRSALTSDLEFDRLVIPGAAGSEDGTPLAAGLEAALRVGGGRSSHRVMVLSDVMGTDTALASGESLAPAARSIAADEIVVDWLRLAPVAGDLRVTGIRPAEQLHAGLTG